MKKILSLVLALVMILSSFSFAFAFDDVDAENETLTAAVSALNALGIIKGYEDGSFKPEKVVTRAEMAKMLIVARGLESLSTDKPSFTDCQSHWAAGYISLAYDLHIINGRGNGIFDPDAPVTYQEAAVMMLRALGYDDKTINGGKSDVYNAANYKVKALNLGLFSDLGSFKMNDGASRGDIALMLNINLQQTMVDTNNDGRAIAIMKDDKEVTLISNIATEATFTVSVDDVKKNDLVDLSSYLYQNITAYKIDKKVVYVVGSNVYTFEGTASVADKKITLKDANDNVVNAKVNGLDLGDAKYNVFYNGAETKYEAADFVNAYVKLVLDKDNKLAGAIIEEFANPVQVSAKYVSGKAKFLTIDLPKNEDGKVDFNSISVVGDATSLEDIQQDDIVEVAKAKDGSFIKFNVTRQTVEGKIAKVANDKYYINGDAYEANGITIKLGDEGIFFLDMNGMIAAFSEKAVEKAPANFAFVLGVANGAIGKDELKVGDDTDITYSVETYPKLKIVGTDGKVAFLDIYCKVDTDGTINTTSSAIGFIFTKSGNDIDTSLSIEPAKTFSGNGVIKYTLNSDGRISKVEVVVLTTVTMETSNVNFLAGDKTVILNDNGNKTYTLTAVDKLNAKIDFKYAGNADGWDLVITDKGIKSVLSGTYGIITGICDVLNADGNPVQEITALVNGENVTYLTKKDYTIANDMKGKVVKLTPNTNNEISSVTAADLKAAGVPSKVTATYLTLTGDTANRYTFSSDLVIYKQASTNAVSVGDIYDVQFIVDENHIQLFDLDGNGTIDIIFILNQ